MDWFPTVAMILFRDSAGRISEVNTLRETKPENKASLREIEAEDAGKNPNTGKRMLPILSCSTVFRKPEGLVDLVYGSFCMNSWDHAGYFDL